MSRPYDGGTNANIVSKTANFTPGIADHGRIFILSGGAITATLPTISSEMAGMEFTFISGDDSEHVVDGGATKMYGVASATGVATGGDNDPIATKSSITLSAGAIGDKITCLCDGTNWYCYSATVSAVTLAQCK